MQGAPAAPSIKQTVRAVVALVTFAGILALTSGRYLLGALLLVPGAAGVWLLASKRYGLALFEYAPWVLLVPVGVALQVVPVTNGLLLGAFAVLVFVLDDVRRGVLVGFALATEAVAFFVSTVHTPVTIAVQAVAYVALFGAALLAARYGHHLQISRRRPGGAPQPVVKLMEREGEKRVFTSTLSRMESFLEGMMERTHETYSLFSFALYVPDGMGSLVCRKYIGPADRAFLSSVEEKWGVLGMAWERSTPSVLNNIRDSRVMLPYRSREADIWAAMIVPVRREGPPLAVLYLDRKARKDFTEVDAEHLRLVAELIVDDLQKEQEIREVQKLRAVQSLFYDAGQQLIATRDLGAILGIVVASFKRLVGQERTLVCLWRERLGAFTIAASDPPALAKGAGEVTLSMEDGMVGLAVRKGHFLPSDGVYRREHGPILADRIKFDVKDGTPCAVLPMVVGNTPLGAIVLLGGDIDGERMEILHSLANVAATSIENGIIVDKLETLATTDEMTGLFNHRSFKERLDEMLERSRRYSVPMAMILGDIDKFKSVNDTYGHQTGDTVLRGVADVLKAAVRRLDMAARYGGEEFALLLENTDAEGARVLAERVRKQIAKLKFDTDKGTLKITISFGIATAPRDTKEAATIVKKADLGLYYAKEHGRNQVVVFSDMPKED